jgi:hypothetical protein
MKKVILAACLVFTLTLLGACGSTEKTASNDSKKSEAAKTKEVTKGKLAAVDYDKLYSDPKKYKGYEVELTGKIFNEPEKDDKGTYFQMWGDPENSEKNTLVAINDPKLQVKADDYVKIKGVVKDQFKGKNGFGAEVTAPAITADSVEKVDYITAVAPTLKEVKLDKEINQNNIIVTLQKVELAKNQTRVYLKIKNNTQAKASFYSNSAKLIVGTSQLEEEYTSPETTGLKEIQSDILPGVETEGVIVYPAIDPSQTLFKLNAEASSDNYDLDFQPYVFDVAVN